MASAPPDASNPNILRDTFSTDFANHSAAWDSLYQHDFHPWDRGGPSLALADLLSQRTDLVPSAQQGDSSKRRTALVPGCGRGHDVLLLQSFGYDVWGLDVSADGIKRAKENVEEYLARGAVKPVDGVELGDAKFVVADFFSLDWTEGLGSDGSGKFDLIFDYTFLCALPPDIRPKWAKQMSQLLSTNGRLICLEFPVGKPLSDQGPPWGLSPEVYEALLAHPGEQLKYNDDGSVIDPPSPKPQDGALHRLCLVKPTRTHKAGTNEDGSVRDFISIWSH